MPLQFFEGMEKQGGVITEFMHPSLMQIQKRERIVDRLYPGSQPHYGSGLVDVISGAVSFLQNNQDLIKSTIGVVGDINRIRKDINHI
jgi:signal peptidase I